MTYTVDNIAGGNGTVGTVSSAGLYTAPPIAGKHTVRVTDAGLNRTSGAVVTVFSSITADYGSRAGTTPPIPADLFGYGRGESIPNVSARNLLGNGGLTVARTSAQIATVYATQTPDWTKIDPLVATIQASGQHAMLQLHQSPSWLQPASGVCAGNIFAAPTDVNQWAQIAASYVGHMDIAFPGVVTDYEIGNEPNATRHVLNVGPLDGVSQNLCSGRPSDEGTSCAGWSNDPRWRPGDLRLYTLLDQCSFDDKHNRTVRGLCQLSSVSLWLLAARGYMGYV